MSAKKYLDSDLVIHKYIVEQLGIKPIAKELCVHERIVKRTLLEEGIVLRSKQEQQYSNRLKIWKDGLKKCSKCNKFKSLSEYHRDKSNSTGYYSACRTCKNIKSKNNRDKNREKYREMDRQRYKSNYIKRRKYSREWRRSKGYVIDKPIAILPKCSEDDLGYFAGLLDGDGSIGLYFSKNHSLVYEVIITNQFIDVLKYIQKFYGGNIYLKSDKGDIYNLLLVGNYSINFIKDILPFLIIKHEQGDLLLEAYNIWNIENSYLNVPFREGKRNTDDLIKCRRKYIDKIKKLKTIFSEDDIGILSLPYIAGILDAEGHIDYRQSIVGITNCDKRILDYCCLIYGGSVGLKNDKNNLGNFPCYVWQICGENANNFALEIVKFCRVKRLKLKKLISTRYEKNLSN